MKSAGRRLLRDRPRHLLCDAEREADDLRVVLIVLRERVREVDRDRRGPEERHDQPEPGADARTHFMYLEVGFNRPGVGKDDAAERIAGQREGHFEAARKREVAADRVFGESAARADAAEFEAADTADPAGVEALEKRRIVV